MNDVSEAGLQKGITDERVRLRFEIDDPVELVEVAAAFGSLSRQYQKVLRQYPSADLNSDEVKLYLTKIETNCILADLGAYAQSALPVIAVMDWHNTFVDFVNRLDSYIKFFRGDAPNGDVKDPSRADCEDLKNILEVVAGKRKGSLHLEVRTSETESSLVYSYTDQETSDALLGVKKQIAESDLVTRAQYEKVLLWFPQLNFEEHKAGGKSSHDKGVIETIHPKQLPVFWLSELDAIKVKSQTVNPSKVSYIVDVNVETKQNIPRAYRVVRLHEIVDD